MELTALLAFGALPVLFLGAAAGLSLAYNRLQERYAQSVRDRDSYLSVLESSNDALFVINFVNGRIYQANSKASELLGHPPTELVGRTIFQLHPKEYWHSSATRIADAWEKKGCVYDDIPLVSAAGEVIAVESSVRVTSYRGDPAIILFARDIRERLYLQGRVAAQQALVREKNEQMLASIRYAQRIQRAVLPEADTLQLLAPESFILFRPRDIVSGDLYWFAEREGKVVVVAADCTGHGVPGALLSLIGASLFDEMVNQRGLLDPGSILDGTRSGMIQALSKRDGESEPQDGMNAAVLVWDRASGMATYAGGFAPLYLVRNGELIELKGDRMPVGPFMGAQRDFATSALQLQEGDRLFLFSDGIQDQFGGADGRKLKSSGLKQWLLETADMPIDDQYQAISDRFRAWKGELEQLDDVLLIGIEVDKVTATGPAPH